MTTQFPIVVSAGTIQDTLYAALRVLSVLIGGGTAILGFVDARDLAGLIAYVRSSDFAAVAGALAAIASFAYGMWKTHSRKRDMVTVGRAMPDSLVTVVEKKRTGGVSTSLALALVCLLPLVALSACASTVDSVRLNSGRAFLTAQIAFKSAQQTTISVCSVPAPQIIEPCNKAINLLHVGAQAEAAGFTAQQAGNSADLQTAIVTLVALPAQLVALGILEAN